MAAREDTADLSILFVADGVRLERQSWLWPVPSRRRMRAGRVPP
jgi:hypothetical protein